MARRQGIEEWLNEAINDKDGGLGDCYAVAVIHYKDETPNVVDRITLGGALSISEIAKRFESKITQYVYDLPGVQRCELNAFYGQSPEPGARLPFTRTGQLGYAQGATEGPTEKGLTQMLMRHMEAIHSTQQAATRALVEGYVQLNRSTLDQNAALVAENERLRNETADAYRIIRDTTTDAERHLQDRDMAIMKEKKSAELQQKLLQWLPALTNTILQRKVFPEATEDSAIVNGLLDAMGPEQIQFFVTMLPPEIAGIVTARANEIMKKRASMQLDRNEVNALLAQSNPEGELQ